MQVKNNILLYNNNNQCHLLFKLISFSIPYYWQFILEPTPTKLIRTWHREPLSKQESDQITSVHVVIIVYIILLY